MKAKWLLLVVVLALLWSIRKPTFVYWKSYHHSYHWNGTGLFDDQTHEKVCEFYGPLPGYHAYKNNFWLSSEDFDSPERAQAWCEGK